MTKRANGRHKHGHDDHDHGNDHGHDHGHDHPHERISLKPSEQFSFAPDEQETIRQLQAAVDLEKISFADLQIDILRAENQRVAAVAQVATAQQGLAQVVKGI